MRHHETERSSPARERRPVPRQTAAPAPSSRTAPARLQELQQLVGNTVVAELLRDSHEHELPRAQHQRAGRAEVTAPVRPGRSETTAGPDARAVQRVESDASSEPPQPGRRGIRERLTDMTGVIERERALSAKYGIRIGPPPGAEAGHFSSALLDRIDSALSDLPLADLGPNEQLIAIERDLTSPYASSYDADTLTVDIVHPIIAGNIRAPGWLYAKLNRGVRWQRKQMDRGSMSGEAGISAEGDRALGIGKGQRHVMAGVSDVLAHGNLVEWTVRHEVGHSVDKMVEWDPGLAAQEHFGGWRVYDADDMDVVARVILRQAELLGVLPSNEEQAVNTFNSLLNPRRARANAAGDESRLVLFFERFKQHLTPEEFNRRSGKAIRFVRLALAQPWTLDNGGADVLDIGGRTYHLDPKDQWVSYSTAQRSRYALSNYQFSNPKEWFAEAYAAYYDPKPEARDRLAPQVRAWFAARGRPAPAQNPAGPGNPAES